MSLLDEVKGARQREGSEGVRVVVIPVEARDALVELADAVSEFFSDTYPTFDTTKRKPVRAALERLQR